MARYVHIASATFDEVPLPLPLSVRLSHRAEPTPAAGDNDAFATSIQLGVPVIVAEVRIRGTATAEGFSLGQQGTLSFTIAPGQSGSAPRTITLAGAVLVAVELAYEQASMATATLKFVAEAENGTTNPFSAEESS